VGLATIRNHQRIGEFLTGGCTPPEARGRSRRGPDHDLANVAQGFCGGLFRAVRRATNPVSSVTGVTNAANLRRSALDLLVGSLSHFSACSRSEVFVFYYACRTT